MSTQLYAQAKSASAPTPAPAFTPVRTGLLQRTCVCGGAPGIDGECAECRRKRLSLQRSGRSATASSTVTVPPIVRAVLRSPGQPLDADTRAFMEPRFGHDFNQVQIDRTTPLMTKTDLAISQPGDQGEQEADRMGEQVMRGLKHAQSHDFSQVRIHADAQAAESARAINALAYTVGRDIVFGSGQYAPGTMAGQRLLAHELTHVVQQKNTHDIHAKLVTGLAQDQYEQQADRVSEQVTDKIAIRWPSLTYSNRSRPVLQRQVASFAASSALMAPGAASSPTTSVGCVQPASVQLVRSYPLQFPGYLTGGGICAVMEAQPAVNNLCPAGIHEEVTLARSGVSDGLPACPGSLLEGFCVGGPPFTPGKSRPRACSGVSIPATGFGDRHSVQLQNISVLHDPKRNPGNLSRCGFTCNQRYYIQAGTTQKTLGRFQIHFELTKSRNITEVTATKTLLGEKGDFPIRTESRRFA